MRDVVEIIKKTKEQQPLELLEKLTETGFVIDISILMDVYGEALGMEWLEQFYKKHENKINDLF